MKNFFSIYILFFIVLSSCGSDKKEELSDIKSSVESAERIVNRYDNNVQSAIESKNFDYIKIVSRSAMDSLAIITNQIISTPIPPSHEELKQAAISYVTALQNIIVAEEAYSELSDSITDREAEDMDHRLLLSSQKAREEQVKFANLLVTLSED